MAGSYLPLTDNGLLSWAVNFSTIVNDAPEGYGVTIEQAAAYTALKDDYEAKLTAATEPATRGGSTVLAKDNAKKALVAQSRALAMLATNFPGVTDDQRYNLGVTVRDTDPTPVPVPEESPNIDVVSVVGWTVELRLHNGDATRRAKPAGVTGANVFTYIGETPPADVAAWKFEGGTTKTSTTVEFANTLAAGTKVWVTAFWFNTKAQSGPAATPVGTQINYGGLSQAA